MRNSKYRQYLLAGLFGVAALGITYGIGRHLTRPIPREVTLHVSGAPETMVTGTVDSDGGQGESREAKLPARFTYTGRRMALTVRRVAGPDQPISVAVDINGARRGTGTASGGVRVHIGDDGAGPFFLAVPSEPEGKETEDAGPPPDLIGTRPPEWTPVEWINSGPLRLADLRGKVVLARWFTGPVCEYCVATAPALREFHQRYSDRGLAVVGMFHHADSTVEEVQGLVNDYGYRFPVAIDRGAKTRRLWSLGREDYGFTSVTFLLDREGVIRYIHPGGQYVKGDADYQVLETAIEQWLDR